MPGRRDYEEKGHAHSLTFSCYHRFPFLKADRTCRWLADAVNEMREELDVAVWAYVFMPNHVHLIVWPRHFPYCLADIRKAVKQPVGRKGIDHIVRHAPEWLPKITRQRGQKTERCFWQSGGGHGRNLYTRKVLLDLIDYIHLNPVRAGLVEQASEWPWSSAAWYEEDESGPIRIAPVPSDWGE